MALRILHLHSTFAAGGKEARAVRLMNAFGERARHTVVSAMPGALGARALIEKGVVAEFPETAPPLAGRPSVARYRKIAGYMQGFDLVLTYNWGAMDAVLARRMFARHLPPLVHHEDGFNADEVERLKTERNLMRRLALPAAHAVVVPSETLRDIATRVWKQKQVRLIANGVAVERYGHTPTRTIPGFARHRGDVVIGTLAGLRPVKNLIRLVRAAAPIPNAVLVIVGEGPDHDAIRAQGEALGMGERLVLPGFLPEPWTLIGHFDIFALSSDSEQAPISLIEAMAAGLPVAAPAVGDVANMVAAENAPYVTPAGDEEALAGALMRLAGNREMRRAIGLANRTRALGAFDEAAMIARYRALYEEAVRWPGALGES